MDSAFLFVKELHGSQGYGLVIKRTNRNKGKRWVKCIRGGQYKAKKKNEGKRPRRSSSK